MRKHREANLIDTRLFICRHADFRNPSPKLTNAQYTRQNGWHGKTGRKSFERADNSQQKWDQSYGLGQKTTENYAQVIYIFHLVSTLGFGWVAWRCAFSSSKCSLLSWGFFRGIFFVCFFFSCWLGNLCFSDCKTTLQAMLNPVQGRFTLNNDQLMNSY